jgi:7-cyano-7-deazaguanine reductase
MPYAEGKALAFQPTDAIDSAVLETFHYEGVEQEINCSTDEFTAVCPYSGLPDIARVTVTYVPNRKCVELKSLKYYYLSFRNVGIYQEHVTDRILRDLVAVLEPKRLIVETDYNVRGGIHTVCRARYDAP